MDRFVATLRRERAVRLLLPLFFLSGATALVYQSIWVRSLELVFGTSEFAVATVLAGFMGGLALGGYAVGRVADRLRRPLAAYGVLEIGIGLYALAFPRLRAAVEPAYLGLHRALDLGPVAFGLVQALLVGLLLVLPTAAMGGSLPLLARFAARRLAETGDRVGRLVGVNTAGAVAGVWLAGFHLLPGLGLARTTWLAAAANVLLGVGALALSSHSREPELELGLEADGAPAPTPDRRRPLALVLLSVALLQGLAGLLHELAWFRILALILGGSAYAFSVMLVAFLVGLAAGGVLGGRLADVRAGRGGVPGVLLLLGAVQLGTGASAFALAWAWQELPFAYVALWTAVGGSFHLTWQLTLLLAGAVMLLPATIMGATLPVLVRAAVAPGSGLGRLVGTLHAWNTLGAIAGAVLGGFVLLPLLHVVDTVRVAVGVNLLAGAIAWWLAGTWSGAGRRQARLLLPATLGVLVAVLRPPWDPMLMTAGMYKYVSDLDDTSREGVLDYAVGRYRMLFYDEGWSSVVTVAQSRMSGNIWLANNGKVDASTWTDMPTQVMVSQLPFLFAEAPRRALMIGLASGISLGSLTLQPGLERIDVVELEPAIVEASHYFDDFNHRPLEDPRVRVHANDGRNHLLLAPPGSYDVIVSEPSNPWISGVSNLFTRDFWEMGRTRLAPGGIWSQWVQLYGMSREDLRSLLASFADVFPHVVLFETIETADLVLLGSDRPLVVDVEAASRLFGVDARLDSDLASLELGTPYDVLALFQVGDAALRAAVADAPRNTDDNMRIEYNAPRNLHRSTSEANAEWLRRNAHLPVLRDVEEALALARAYARREDERRARLLIGQVLRRVPEDRRALALLEQLEDG